jgi:hypothetical protein
MSKKDFILIADIVSQITDNNQRKATAHKFMTELRALNPAFKPLVFLKACKV